MRPTLRDPHAGPEGARAYLKHWGQALYLAWCEEHRVEPVSYAVFCELTLKHGRDWWCARRSNEFD